MVKRGQHKGESKGPEAGVVDGGVGAWGGVGIEVTASWGLWVLFSGWGLVSWSRMVET